MPSPHTFCFCFIPCHVTFYSFLTCRPDRTSLSAETDRLIREYGDVDPDLDQDWSQLAEGLLSDALTCPLCQAAPAQLTPDLRLTCRCGLAVRAPSADLQHVGEILLDSVASHEAVCAEPELFFSQSDGELTVFCAGCGMQGLAFQWWGGESRLLWSVCEWYLEDGARIADRTCRCRSDEGRYDNCHCQLIQLGWAGTLQDLSSVSVKAGTWSDYIIVVSSKKRGMLLAAVFVNGIEKLWIMLKKIFTDFQAKFTY